MMRTIWKIAPLPTTKVRKALSHFPPAVQTVLNNRGIYTKKAAEGYFKPDIKDLNDPDHFYSMAGAVKAIESAIKNKEKIVIHGDFDVDGITATAILLHYLKRARSADVFAYIPHRVDEGYGLTEQSINEVLKQGAKLIISVDCGIRDSELVKKTMAKGVKMIITDHHDIRIEKGKPYLPPASAVLHPRHPKGKYLFGELAGAGVAWKLVCAIEKARTRDELSKVARSYLDLVALATVCDVMPLIGENRIIVKEGLKQLKRTEREGLKALIKQTALTDKALQAYHLGFVIGPRLNAAGRLSSAMDALNLLSAETEYEALALAEQLEALNTDRQNITQIAIAEAEEKISKIKDSPIYYVSDEGWKDGIIGLVAGRLTEKYYRPTVIVRLLDDEAKGSARSVKGYDIVEAFSASSKFLTRYGGHSLAAGFSTTTKLEPKFREAIFAHAQKSLTPDLLIKTLNIDYQLSADEINFALIDYLEKLEPTGFGNPTPVFSLGPVELVQLRPVGQQKNHLKLTVKDPKTNKIFEAIWFEAPSVAFSLEQGTMLNLAFNLSRSTWNNRDRIDLRIKAISLAR